MKLITLHLPEPYIRALDQLVNDRYYPNRAEAIRTAVRDLLMEEAWGATGTPNQNLIRCPGQKG